MQELYLQGNWFFSRFQITFGKPIGLSLLRVPSQIDNSRATSTSTSRAASPKFPRSNFHDPLGKDLPLPKLGIPLHDEEATLPLGRGAFGKAYLVDSKKSRFAVKEIDTGEATRHYADKTIITFRQVEEFIPHIAVEPKAMHRVSGHPNIPQFLGSVRTHDAFQIATEYIPGESLKGKLLSEHQAKSSIRQLLSALQHCHERGVAHLDVKPGNLIRDPKTGKTTLLDFGEARFFNPENPEILRDLSAGNAAYRPRFTEQYNPILIDIYAAGITLSKILLSPSDWAQDFINQCTDMKTSIPELLEHEWFM